MGLHSLERQRHRPVVLAPSRVRSAVVNVVGPNDQPAHAVAYRRRSTAPQMLAEHDDDAVSPRLRRPPSGGEPSPQRVHGERPDHQRAVLHESKNAFVFLACEVVYAPRDPRDECPICGSRAAVDVPHQRVEVVVAPLPGDLVGAMLLANSMIE